MTTLKDQIKKNRKNNNKEKEEMKKFNKYILNNAKQIAKFIDEKVNLKEKFMNDIVKQLSNKYKATLKLDDYTMKAKYELANTKDKNSSYSNAAEKLGFNKFDGLYLDYIIDVVNKFDDGHVIDVTGAEDYLQVNIFDDYDIDVDLGAIRDEMGCLQLNISATFYYKDYIIKYTECQYEQPDFINYVSKIKIDLGDMNDELEKQGINMSYKRIKKDDSNFDTLVKIQLDDDY